MAEIVTIAGSPSYPSKSHAVLTYASSLLRQDGFQTAAIAVRDLLGEARNPFNHSSLALP